MEIEACRRAEEIEAEGRAQYNKMMEKISAVVASLKSEYEQIRSGTAVTAAHLCGEMNRMGERIELVNLVLDKTAKGFDELDGLIEDNKKVD
jgi:molybdopterin synthase catalytic subunit